jgi:hypothetical protein
MRRSYAAPVTDFGDRPEGWGAGFDVGAVDQADRPVRVGDGARVVADEHHRPAVGGHLAQQPQHPVAGVVATVVRALLPLRRAGRVDGLDAIAWE